jgi:hypothetical protein
MRRSPGRSRGSRVRAYGRGYSVRVPNLTVSPANHLTLVRIPREPTGRRFVLNAKNRPSRSPTGPTVRPFLANPSARPLRCGERDPTVRRLTLLLGVHCLVLERQEFQDWVTLVSDRPHRSIPLCVKGLFRRGVWAREVGPSTWRVVRRSVGCWVREWLIRRAGVQGVGRPRGDRDVP